MNELYQISIGPESFRTILHEFKVHEVVLRTPTEQLITMFS